MALVRSGSFVTTVTPCGRLIVTATARRGAGSPPVTTHPVWPCVACLFGRSANRRSLRCRPRGCFADLPAFLSDGRTRGLRDHRPLRRGRLRRRAGSWAQGACCGRRRRDRIGWRRPSGRLVIGLARSAVVGYHAYRGSRHRRLRSAVDHAFARGGLLGYGDMLPRRI